MSKKADSKPKLVIILLLIPLLAVILYFGICIYIADQMTKPEPSPLTVAPTEISPEYEDVQFNTSDGLTLPGWLFKGNTDKVAIFVPGSNQNRSNSGYMTVSIAKEFIQKGYNVLLFDRRSTGNAEMKRVTLGLTEGRDVLAAVDFVKKKGFEAKKIAIIGNSLGAISTLMVIDGLKEVGAIVSDSAAAEVRPVVENILTREKHVPSVFFPGVFLAGKVVFGIDVEKIKPIEKIPLVPERKILFLHGEADPVIDVSNSQRLLSAANPESKLVLFKGAGHVQTYKTDPELYRREVYGFLDTELK